MLWKQFKEAGVGAGWGHAGFFAWPSHQQPKPQAYRKLLYTRWAHMERIKGSAKGKKLEGGGEAKCGWCSRMYPALTLLVSLCVYVYFGGGINPLQSREYSKKGRKNGLIKQGLKYKQLLETVGILIS